MSNNSLSYASKRSEVAQGSNNRTNSDLSGLAVAMEKLANTNLQDAPYTLTVPSDAPYTLRPGQKDQWRIDTPFEAHEEDLQYVTFLYRDPVDSLFALRSNCAPQSTNKSPFAKNGTPSGTSTPLQSSIVKKKISLSAYKNKTKITTEASPPLSNPNLGGNHLAQLSPGDSKDFTANEQTSKILHTETSDTRIIKRPSDPGTKDLNAATSVPPKNDGNSEKALVLPIEQPIEPSKHEKQVQHRAQSPSATRELHLTKSKAMQPSQVFPNSVIEISTSDISSLNALPSGSPIRRRLPPISIALPCDTFEAESLPELLSSKPQNFNFADKLSDFKTLQIPLLDEMATDHCSLPSDEIASSGRMLPSASANTFSRRLATNASQLDPEYSNAASKTKSLIVKLRFAKSGRKRVIDLLKMRSQRKEDKRLQTQYETQNQSENTIREKEHRRVNGDFSHTHNYDKHRILDKKDRHETESFEKKGGIAPDSVRVDKRRREEEVRLEQPQKRQKQSTEVENIKTPQVLSSQSHSPGPTSQPSSHRRNLSTPMKDLKASGTHVSNGVMTPQASSSTPLAPGSAEQKASKPHTPGDKKSPHTWNEEYKRLCEIGRQLKHKMEAIIRERENEDGPAQSNKSAALLGLECVLCYVLAFSAKDKISAISKNVPRPLEGWRTVLPLWKVVRHAVQREEEHQKAGEEQKEDSYLLAMAHLLGSVCRARIAAIEAENYTKATSPPPNTQQKVHDTFENLNELRISSAIASKVLSSSNFAERYPRTYAVRPASATGILVKTIPIVKMVALFLEEWNEGKKRSWKRHVELGLCGDL